jgi:transcriptional regulator with XRE-family HTH domain
MSRDHDARLYPALLRHWRTGRGQSQLDLACAANVSSRHVSFLETGRARPSREMVLRLGAALDVPLRDQNAMLRAAGLPAEYPEPAPGEAISPAVDQALARMLAQHEPFPMVVASQAYDVVRTNGGAARLLARIVPDPAGLPRPGNLLRLLFDPRLARPALVDWERTARALLARAQRELLARPSDGELGALVRALLDYPDVPADFARPDLGLPSEPAFALRLRCAGESTELAFLSAITRFSAPQNVALDELRLESFFPLDEATARACAAWAQPG